MNVKQAGWAIAIVVVSLVPLWAIGERLSVQVQTGQVRETPSFMGRVVTVVNYADRVNVIDRQGPWRKITTHGGTGWIHESALSRTRIQLTAGADDVSRTATGEEIALAGKGFNSQVEAEFKDKNQTIDFTWIDRMETFKATDAAIVRFVTEGGLKP